MRTWTTSTTQSPINGGIAPYAKSGLGYAQKPTKRSTVLNVAELILTIERSETFIEKMEESLENLKSLWRALTPKEGEPCTYCNVLATDKEHVTPISWIEKAKAMKDSGIDIEIPEEIIVPSCHECNAIASDRIFDTLREKKRYIRFKLVVRYKKWMLKEEWTDEELEGLGGELRRRTVLYNEIIKAVKVRMKYIGGMAILRDWDYWNNLYGN